jgi:RNA-directed DNA polymerase
MVRYADDFILCVQNKDEAEKILEVLRRRLGKSNLVLAEDKTRILEFGRHAKTNAKARGEKSETFNFLGFTHFIDVSRKGFLN